MDVTEKEMREEAVEYMKQLRLYDDVIADFADRNQISISDQLYMGDDPDGDDGSDEAKEYELMYTSYQGKIYSLCITAPTEERLRVAEELWEKSHILVYHIHRTETPMGNLYAFLYVSPNREDWEPARRNLEKGMLEGFGMLVRDDTPIYPLEAGTVTVKPANGCLLRL